MNKEYEAIAAKFAGEIYDATSVENAHGIVRSAVESCYKLANKPPRELTDAEIDKIFRETTNSIPGTQSMKFARALEAAAHAKQREPQVVKFRAAMNKESGAIEMLRDGNSLPTAWCFLEPAQEFEVRT